MRQVFREIGMVQRAIAWAVRMGLGLAFLAPLVALLPAAVLDAPPRSGVRFSLFPLALAAYDPFVWTCLGNGFALSACVSIGSVLVGITLGRILANRRSWMRPMLAWLVLAPAVIPPAFLALGLLRWFGPDGPPAWIRVIDESIQWVGYPGQTWPWFVWGWSALAQGVALVALATFHALARVDPARGEAAALVGASRPRIWRALTWPEVRPCVAEAAGMVFVVQFADPGAPLILGLRRTPGFQLISLATGRGSFPRVAAITILASLVSLLVWTLVRWWGGPPLRSFTCIREGGGFPGPDASSLRSPRSGTSTRSILSRLASTGFAVAWSAATLLPLAGLLIQRPVSVPSSGDQGVQRVQVASLGGLGILMKEPASSVLLHSLILGLGVLLVIRFVAWAAPPSRVAAGTRRRSPWLEAAAMGLPPLVWGIVLVAMARVCRYASPAVPEGTPLSSFARAFGYLSTMFDPGLFPGVPLLLAVCLAIVPRRLIGWSWPRGREDTVRRRLDQAILSGAGPGRAHRLAQRDVRSIPVSRLILWTTLAATGVSPAIVLSAQADSAPAGPGVVILADQPGDSRDQAAALAVAAIVANLAAFSWGRAGRPAGGPGGVEDVC
jgi:ABC-type Fe3+ transport system permease subunit